MNRDFNTMLALRTYYYPDHSSERPHWTKEILMICNDGYQEFLNIKDEKFGGYTLIVQCCDDTKEYWGFGQKFDSEEEMNKFEKLKAYW